MKLRITLKNQFKTLSFHLLGTAAMIIVLYFLNFERYSMIVFGAMWVLLTIPVLILHIEYYSRNKGMEIEIQDDQILTIESGKGASRNYAFRDLEKIILYKAASLDKGGMPILPLEYYHYARITPKGGEDIIITCLMIPDVEDAIKEIKWVPYERKKVFFASLN